MGNTIGSVPHALALAGKRRFPVRTGDRYEPLKGYATQPAQAEQQGGFHLSFQSRSGQSRRLQFS